MIQPLAEELSATTVCTADFLLHYLDLVDHETRRPDRGVAVTSRAPAAQPAAEPQNPAKTQ